MYNVLGATATTHSKQQAAGSSRNCNCMNYRLFVHIKLQPTIKTSIAVFLCTRNNNGKRDYDQFKWRIVPQHRLLAHVRDTAYCSANATARRRTKSIEYCVSFIILSKCTCLLLGAWMRTSFCVCVVHAGHTTYRFGVQSTWINAVAYAHRLITFWQTIVWWMNFTTSRHRCDQWWWMSIGQRKWPVTRS